VQLLWEGVLLGNRENKIVHDVPQGTTAAE
jgi:hypothetical protein